MFRTPVFDGQRPVFGIAGYDDPLVVAGGQRNLGDALGGGVMLSRSQSIKFCVVRFVVEKTVLIMIVGHDVFLRQHP